MANRSHLIGVAERYARQSILRNIDGLEVESSSINSKTCSLAFSTTHCGIAVKFPTELLEEMNMSGEVEESEYESEESEDDGAYEEEVKPKKALKKKGKK